MIDIQDLIRRMRQAAVTERYEQQDDLDALLTGTYTPQTGDILPTWRPGSPRRDAWQRALKKVASDGKKIVSARIDGAIGTITWSDTTPTGETILTNLDVPRLARLIASDYISHGITALLPYTDEAGTPRLDRLTGMLEPYTHPNNTNLITGLYRTQNYLDRHGKLRWLTEVYDFDDQPDELATHRYWRNIAHPTAIGGPPDEEMVGPRPVYALDTLDSDGRPVGQLEAAQPIMLGLYATELMLATTEELASYPMLKVKGQSTSIEAIGPAEVIGVEVDGDAEWMKPDTLDALRVRRMEKREALREACFLPAGSLGTDTPSGEALREANRLPMQMNTATAKAVSGVLTRGVSEYLAMQNAGEVVIEVQPDQSHERQLRWEALQTADDLGAIPLSVKARIVQELIGGAYSDEELEAFLSENQRPTLRLAPGEIA